MNSFKWEENVRRVIPYTPGEQPKIEGIIKLNTNENPFPPSPAVEKLLRDYDSGRLRLYPDPEATVLVNAIAEEYGVKPTQIFTGVGSDDVISMAFLTFFNSDKPVLFPDITYSFYEVWADVYRIPYKTVPVMEDFSINPKDYCCENGGIIIPNPNAPTGLLAGLDVIEEILKANSDSVVIIDEAYIDFGGESCLSLVDKYDNLLITQTFSKSRSMAGMRIGFAIGNEQLIRYMNDVKFSINSYTMNPLSQICGAAAVRDREYFNKTISEIIRVRENTKRELSLLGFEFPDSMSNFIFAKHKTVSGDTLFNALKDRKIFVRHWNRDRIGDYLRITIGTEDDMNALITALKDILNGL